MSQVKTKTEIVVPVIHSGHGLEPMPLDEWLKEVNKMPKREELIQGLLPIGEAMLVSGDPWTGKSLENQMLAVAFGAGGTFHGLQLKKCRAFYMTWEGSTEGLKDRFTKLNNKINPELPPIVKMCETQIHINTKEGYEMMDNLLCSVKDKYPDVEVVLFDSFPYTIEGNINKDEVISAWWEALMKLMRKYELTPIFVYEENKGIVFEGADVHAMQQKDKFSLKRLKGSYQIAYKANTVIMIGEQKCSMRDKKGVHRGTKGHIIAAPKVKDGSGEFIPLQVNLNRDNLLFEGQTWQWDEELKIYQATETPSLN